MSIEDRIAILERQNAAMERAIRRLLLLTFELRSRDYISSKVALTGFLNDEKLQDEALSELKESDEKLHELSDKLLEEIKND